MRKAQKYGVLFWMLGTLAVLAGCPGPSGESGKALPPGDVHGEMGRLTLKVTGILPKPPATRALMAAQRAKIVLTDPQGTILPEYVFELGSNGSGTLSVEGLLPGNGYKVDLSLYNLVVSETVPQVQGSTWTNIQAGASAQAAIICLPVDPQVLSIDGFPWTAAIGAGGEVWGQLGVAVEGRYSFSLTQESQTLRIFDGTGVMLGEISSALPFTYEATASGVLYLGLYGSQAGDASVALDVTFPSPQEGSSASPQILVPSQEGRIFALGALGSGAETSWYQFTQDSPGDWWLDLPYTSDFRWDLSSLQTPGTVISSGTNSTGMKFEGLTPGEYLLVMRNLKSPGNLRLSGRLLNPELVLTQAQNQGAPDQPSVLPLDQVSNLKIGGRNFDSTSWYSFTAGATGWQEFLFGEAGTGSYNVDLFQGNFDGVPLLTWSGAENQSQGIKLNPGSVYGLKASGVFSSGIKAATWPLEIKTGPLPAATDLTPGEWHTLTLAAGTSAWYRFPVTPGQWYLVRWDDKTQGTGTAAADVRVSVYGKNREEAFLLYKDKGYTTRWVVQAPPGEDELYCYVQGFSPSSTGSYGLRTDLESGGLQLQVQ